MLPDRSILIGQKLVENAKNSNATFSVIFKQNLLGHSVHTTAENGAHSNVIFLYACISDYWEIESEEPFS